MNFSSAARLASMVTERKRGSTRRRTADRSAVSDASRTCEEFWSWFRRRTPSVPEVRIDRRRSELATPFMTGDRAAARALRFLRYFLVYSRQTSFIRLSVRGGTEHQRLCGRTGEPGSRAVCRHKQCINGR